MKIYDCFTFFNELEILEIRLQELYDSVDCIVLVESSFTHSGKPKKLFFNDNKDKFTQFLDKINHVIVNDMPNTANPWDNEKFQRQCIWRGLEKIEIGDLIMISDADEIPSSVALKKKKSEGFEDYNIFAQKLNYIFLNTFAGDWNGTKTFVFNGDRNINLTDDIRYKKDVKDFEKVLIKDGGWHFSYMGDVKRIQTKIQSFAHQELNNRNVLNPKRITDCMKNAFDPVHGNKMTIVEIDDSYPKYIRENKEKYNAFIKER